MLSMEDLKTTLKELLKSGRLSLALRLRKKMSQWRWLQSRLLATPQNLGFSRIRGLTSLGTQGADTKSERLRTMPRSDTSNRDWVAKKIVDLYPETALDVGPGEGAYGRLLTAHSPLTTRHAVEIWAPYIEQYRLENIYHRVYVCDARIFFNYKYDLVILGDVLEHMSRAEALALWSVVSSSAKAAIISMPIIHYPQGEEEGNPYETHVEEDWSHDEILSSFVGIQDFEKYRVTASYFAQFSN